MTIDELYRFVDFIANKEQAAGYFTPTEFNLAVSRAFIEWVTDTYGGHKQNIQGQEIAFQDNQKVSDDLRFLLVNREFNIATGGTLTIPNGSTTDIANNTAEEYMYFVAARHKYVFECDGVYTQNEVPVKMLREDELGGVLKSRIVRPKRDFPVMVERSTTFQFYPTTLNRVVLSYLRKPVVPVWGSTTVSGVPVYDSGTSTQIESPDYTHNDLAIRVLRYFGINIREPQLQQYSEMMKQTKI